MYLIMKRIIFNGRKMSKFDIAYEMGMWHSISWVQMLDVLSYSDLVSRFSDYCKYKGFSFIV